MDARHGLSLLLGLLIGAGGTWLWLRPTEGEVLSGPPSRPASLEPRNGDPAAIATGADSALNGGAARGTAPRLEGSPAPASPVPLSATDDARFHGLVKELGRQVAERDSTIRALQSEVERLRGTLPDVGILRELSRASLEDLEGLGRAIRIAAEDRLLKPSPAWADRHAAFLAKEGAGLARILPRGRYDALIERRGGGAYWSFVKKDNSYDKEPDLELQQGMFSSGFYGGNDGRLLDLGEMPLEDVEADPARAPRVLDQPGREAWAHFFQERPVKTRAGEFLHGASGAQKRVKAVPGRTYVLRSILEREHDVLVAFHVLEQDETAGMTLLWRVLRTWEPWEGHR